MGRLGKAALLGVLVAGSAAGGAVAARAGNETSEPQDAATATLSTIAVEQRDLVTYDETDATLGFTSSATVSAPVAGTITAILDEGQTVDAGTTVASIDGAPVVAMIGDIPGYRALSTSSTDGADVRQLEANLVALGFDPDGEIEIDTSFDDATAAAVTRWENGLGLTGDGQVPQSEVVFIPGRLLVDTISGRVGGTTSAGAALFTARLAERRFLVSATRSAGAVVDRFATPDTAVTTGTVLFWEGGYPVAAVEGDAATRPRSTAICGSASRTAPTSICWSRCSPPVVSIRTAR